jgi:hypothetical protein
VKRIYISLLLFISFTSNASLITHNGYTLNTETNIVSSSDIEWLQWDETQGQSIDDALATHDGWALASNEQMAILFNDFFPYQYWSAGDNGGANSLPYTDQVTPQLDFISLFGFTEYVPIGVNGNDVYSDAFYSIKAAYGSNEQGLYREAIVNDAFAGTFYMGGNMESYGVGASAELTLAQITSDHAFFQQGVALVRSTSVPEPSSLVLMLFGWFLIYMYNKKINKDT